MSEHFEKRIKALAIENPKIQAESKIDRRHFNKRTPGTGRKPKEIDITRRGIKAYLDSHFNESLKIKITDPKTGKEKVINKPRLVIVLEKLYEIGTQGEGSSDALNKWLDRALGKPLQTVGGDEDKPILLKIDF